MTLDPDGTVEVTRGKFKPIPELTPEDTRYVRCLFKCKRELLAEQAALRSRLIECQQAPPEEAAALTDASPWYEIQSAGRALRARLAELEA